jgi:hypothetical protein
MSKDLAAQCHELIDKLTEEQLTVALAAFQGLAKDQGAQGGPLPSACATWSINRFGSGCSTRRTRGDAHR